MSKFQKERGGEITIGQTSKNNKKEKDKSKLKKVNIHYINYFTSYDMLNI